MPFAGIFWQRFLWILRGVWYSWDKVSWAISVSEGPFSNVAAGHYFIYSPLRAGSKEQLVTRLTSL